MGSGDQRFPSLAEETKTSKLQEKMDRKLKTTVLTTYQLAIGAQARVNYDH